MRFLDPAVLGGPPTDVHGQLRQVAEATACNSSKVLLNLVVNGSDAMTEVEAVRRRLLVRTERTREKDTAPDAKCP